MFFFDPLDQFSIFQVFGNFGSSFYNLNNVSLVGTLNFIVLVLWIQIPWYYSNVRNWGISEIFSCLVEEFIYAILNENIAIKHKNFLNFLYMIFLFVFISNLVGMVPFSLTVTSYFLVSFYFALATFIALNIIGFVYNGSGIWKLFLPEGIPVVISLILVPIEFVSYVCKVLSLSIRLFANMMSGHILLKILISFAWTMIWLGSIFSFVLTLAPLSIIFLVICLEFIIASLQAYVFTVLVAIYLNDVINLH